MKILASDYDATFYLNEEDFKKNIEASKRFMKDNIFIIATGRSYRRFKITNVLCDWVIINHGATILKDDKIIYNIELDNDLKNDLVKILKTKKIVDSFACSGYESDLTLEDNNLTKVHARYETVEDAKEITKLLLKYKDKINMFPIAKNKAVEIVDKSVSKSDAIKFVSDLEKVDKNDVYTIGDNFSDIKMIKEFNGFCMENSIDEVKMYARKEYSSVSNLIEDILNNKV